MSQEPDNGTLPVPTKADLQALTQQFYDEQRRKEQEKRERARQDIINKILNSLEGSLMYARKEAARGRFDTKIISDCDYPFEPGTFLQIALPLVQARLKELGSDVEVVIKAYNGHDGGGVCDEPPKYEGIFLSWK